MKKTSLYKRRHPIDACPFEALYDGAWWSIKSLSIREGIVDINFEHNVFDTEEIVSIANLRMRSRKANISDCILLRPGVDICVSSSTSSRDAGSTKASALFDAKISSIKRQPHEFGCTCQFYVNVCRNNDPLVKEGDKLDKEIQEVVVIDDIAVLQELDKKPCEDGYYRWSSSKDCLAKTKAKLFRGQFLYDVSWLLVTSTLKGYSFDITSMQKKLIYRLLDGDRYVCSLGSDKIVNAINFHANDDGVLKANIRTFVPEVSVQTSVLGKTIKQEEDALDELYEDGFCDSWSYEIMDLRRSKRRNVQPDRFVGYDFRTEKSHVDQMEAARKKRQREEVESPPGMSNLDDDGYEEQPNQQSEKTVHDCRHDLDRYFLHTHVKPDTNDESFKSSVLDASPPIRNDPVLIPQLHPSDRIVLNQLGSIGKLSTSRGIRRVQVVQTKNKSGRKQCNLEGRLEERESSKNKSGRKQWNLEDVLEERESSKNKSRRKKQWNLEDGLEEERESKNKSGRKKQWNLEEDGLEERESRNGFRRKNTASFSFKRRKYYDPRRYYTRRFASSREYKTVIEKCMKNINSNPANHQSDPVSQWKSFQTTTTIPSLRWRDVCNPPVTHEVTAEEQELDSLWKEMEMSSNAFQCFEECQTSIVEFSKEDVDVEKSSERDDIQCQHDYQLVEEIGLICQLCGLVTTEIRYMTQPFIPSTGWTRDKEQFGITKASVHTHIGGDIDFDIIRNPDSAWNITLQEENENVWALIPDLKNKLHIHQKKAFEFLWRNFAGSLYPSDMEDTCRRTGGCVISHSPGAGKTLLVIAFLVSYLRLFPGKRPLIIAPNTTLYTWEKEFKKWEVPIPLYRIHSRQNYKKELQNQTVSVSTGTRRMNQDVMHAIDCLDKLRKWHEHPSVILISYPCFFSLMREKSQFEYWRYTARVLRESPGVLILDEGHNPRSTKSKLRKVLMEVKTELRILLSGTLFQNSFEEYFNTLCLARPSFTSQVLKKLDPYYGQRNRRKSTTSSSKQNLARKLFVDKIARRINSNVEHERRRGLRKLKRMTNGFVDVYEGGVSDKLPGLQAYVLLIKPTPTQEKALLKLEKYSSAVIRYSLELEVLITLVSIHPWLITTIDGVDKYFSPYELEELEKQKSDWRNGSKVTFVVNLVSRCIVKNEKVLIFCRNIAPMKLFMEIFERIFGWKVGNEVLILHGDQLLFERSRVIDKFEESGGVAQVLIASIGACGEGISLTAASRVVLLDSEWNPSKIKQAVGRAFRPGQEKMVYVYQLLTSGTVEEKKHNMTTWKDWVSRMIFVGSGVEDSSCYKAENIDDDVLREMVEEDENKSFHMIMKDDKISNGSTTTVRGKELMQIIHSSSLELTPLSID